MEPGYLHIFLLVTLSDICSISDGAVNLDKSLHMNVSNWPRTSLKYPDRRATEQTRRLNTEWGLLGQIDFGIGQSWNLKGLSGGSWQHWPAKFQTIWLLRNGDEVWDSWEVDEFGFYDTVGCEETPLQGTTQECRTTTKSDRNFY